MRKLIFSMHLIAFALHSLTCHTSFAADQAQTLRSGPCNPVILQFCPEPELTGGDLFKCLLAHRAQRSEACNDDLGPLLLDAEEVPEKCRADVIEVCPKAGEGRVKKCLLSRHTELSPQCRVALEDDKAP